MSGHVLESRRLEDIWSQLEYACPRTTQSCKLEPTDTFSRHGYTFHLDSMTEEWDERIVFLQDLPRQTYTLDPTLYEIAWFNILSKLQRISSLQYLMYGGIYVYSTPRFVIHSNWYIKASMCRLRVLPILQNKQDNDQKGKVHIQNRPKLPLQLTSQNTYISPMKPEQAFVADG